MYKNIFFKKIEKMLDKFESIGYNNQALRDADVAHPVERHLAKVEVASSSLVTRSKRCEQFRSQRFFVCSDADDLRTGPPRRGPYDPLGWL